MFRLIICLLTSVLLAASVSAGVTTYTDQSAFTSALPAGATLTGTDFDSLTAGTTILDGDTVDGITFNYTFTGATMKVSTGYLTTSMPNFLGTNDVDIFQDGDDFMLGFAPQNAIGMYFITADTMADDDISLTFGSTTVSLVAADIQEILLDGSKVYFLGIINTGNTFSAALVTTVAGGLFLYNVDDIVLAGPTAEVVGLHIFYENSAWDDPDGPTNPLTGEGASEFDDDAIADKQALLPGGEALFINYTSYDRGINGIMIDVDGLIAVPTLETVGSFFAFRVGNDDTYTSPGWVTAPAPIDVQVRMGDGDLASDRITLIWADNAIEKQWLEVTMLANGSTGLTTPHVHFWGNAIGETGNDPANATVNATDQTGARDNFTTFINPADIMNPYDFNRDKRVNATDQTIARDNFTSFFTVLRLINPPTPGARGLGDGGRRPAADSSVLRARPTFDDALVNRDSVDWD